MALRTNLTQDCEPRERLDSRIAVRKEKALGKDGTHQDGQRNPPEVPFDRVRIAELFPGLKEGEESTDAEQHYGDDEGVDIALTSVPEGVLGTGGTLRLLAAHQQEELVSGIGDGVDRLGKH
ncbi:hypothetical protein QE394_000328 [Arthrobacter sp. SORGH_AS 212]|nr:hypothetical protein [Arthrobacter sp. SORGH_AS_0212]